MPPFDVKVDERGMIIFSLFGEIFDLYPHEANDLANILASAYQEAISLK